MSSSEKTMIFLPLFSPNPHPNHKPLSFSTHDHHELPLLAVGPLHRVELFDRSRTFKIQLEDSIHNGALDPPFPVFSK